MTNEESSHSLIFLFSLSQIHALGIVGMIICDFLRLHSLNLALVNFRNPLKGMEIISFLQLFQATLRRLHTLLVFILFIKGRGSSYSSVTDLLPFPFSWFSPFEHPTCKSGAFTLIFRGFSLLEVASIPPFSSPPSLVLCSFCLLGLLIEFFDMEELGKCILGDLGDNGLGSSIETILFRWGILIFPGL